MHQLITGGFETTTSALAHGIWLLIEYPETQKMLRSNPELIDNFIEEALRFWSPVQGLARMTTEDTEVSGTTIPAGSMVSFGMAPRIVIQNSLKIQKNSISHETITVAI